MNVGHVMTTRVSWVGPDFTVSEVARRMRSEEIGALPVAHNDRLIGMVTDRDIVLRAVADGGEIERVTARQVMTGPVLYCFEDESISAVLKKMADKQVRRLPVLGRNKRLVGVVSLGGLSLAAEQKAGGAALREISEKRPSTRGSDRGRLPLESPFSRA
jgi:CBS domain-containing protein